MSLGEPEIAVGFVWGISRAEGKKRLQMCVCGDGVLAKSTRVRVGSDHVQVEPLLDCYSE